MVARSPRWTEPARAYASALLDPPLSSTAVAETLDRLSAERDDAPDGEAVLSVLRDIVAQRMRQSTAAAEPPRVVDRLPVLLAARASSCLEPADLERLAQHLASCPACATVEERVATAEQAFHSVSPARWQPPGRRLALSFAIIALGAAGAVVVPGALDSSPSDPGRGGSLTIAAPPAPWPPRPAISRPPAEHRRAHGRAGAGRGETRPARRRAHRAAVVMWRHPAVVVVYRPVRAPVTALPVQRPRTPSRRPARSPGLAPSTDPLPSPPSPDPGRQPPAG